MLKAFGKDLLIYGLSSSFGKFVTLLLVPVYTRIFSPEVYGIMDLISTIVTICAVLGTMQLESAVSRYYYAEKEESSRNRMVSTALWSILCISLLLVLTVFIFATKLSIEFFKTTEYSSHIVIACLIIPVANLTSLFTVVIRFKKKPVHYLFFQLLQIGITIGLTIFLTVYLKTGIIGVFIGQLAGFAISVLLMSIYLRHQLAFTWNATEFKKMAHFSLPLVPSVAGGWANSYVNRFVMLGYLSVTEIGLYAVALKISSVFQLLGSTLRMAWGPFFWETFERNPNHREVFKMIQKEFSSVILMIVVVITLFSKEIILILTTGPYLPAAQLIGLISLSIAITSIIEPLTGVGPGITKKTKYNTLIYFLSLPVNIASLFILVPLIGVIGVPISLLIGNLVFLIVGWYNSERLYYIGFKKLPMFINFIGALGIILIDMHFNLHILIKILITCLFVIYLAIKYGSKLIPLVKRYTTS